MPEGPDVPRVDELFSRAVVAQLAEQRAQRETFAQIERRLELLEHLVSERLAELSKLLRGGELELRLELFEEDFGARLGRMTERLDAVSQAMAESAEGDLLQTEEVSRRLAALESALAQRLGRMEEAVRGDEVSRRLAGLELTVTERLGHLEQLYQTEDVGRRLEALEASSAERLGHLEESLRSEEIGHRLKALELAVDERSSRLEEFVRAGELEQRVASLHQAMEERLAELRSSISTGGGGEDSGARFEALDQSVGLRLNRLEGTLRHLEEQTAARLEDLQEANTAAEVGILERIVAESQVVGAHFEAVRPVVEALSHTGPELETALAELRALVARAGRSEMPPHPAAVLELPPDEEEDTLFLPPEETPIPERRFGGILPRRDH